MTKATYWQRGESLDYLNETSDVIEAGTVLELAERIGVVGCDILPEQTGSVHVTGVFLIDKTDASEEIAMGASVYYDGTGITSASSGTAAGWAAQASAADDAGVYVKIG